jgi:hypothetical protein
MYFLDDVNAGEREMGRGRGCEQQGFSRLIFIVEWTGPRTENPAFLRHFKTDSGQRSTGPVQGSGLKGRSAGSQADEGLLGGGVVG